MHGDGRRKLKLDSTEMEEDRHRLTFETHRGGKDYVRRIFESSGLLQKASIHPGSISAVHVRTIEASPQDHRVSLSD